MQDQNDQEWTPPPPSNDDSIFSSGTREHYAKEINLRARNSLIFGILSLFCCGLIFGFLGYSAGNDALNNIDTYDVGHEKRGMAQAGKILSIIGFIFWLAWIIFSIAFWPTNFGR